ncbi:MAG TPA: 2-keto-3-deoxy-L-rhamnonate aldolase, partial [Gammaproteobacteria bacterium]|nr:2-keto-3-deoxy-L-rhamnonate aldolase [Gammaproteobacteria bacterium]
MTKRNQFKQALQGTKTQFGLWQGIPDTTVAEIGAGAGFDWVLIDA